MILFNFNFNSLMEFHKVSQVNQTALDVAQSKGIQEIVELLSHANQN